MKPRGMMIIHNFRPNPVGGAELQAERLAERLVEMGHEIHVLTQQIKPDEPQDELLKGIKIHRAKFHLAYWITHGADNTFRYLVRHRLTYDILNAHITFGHAVVAVVVARCFGKKSIVKIACAGEFGDLAIFSKFDGFEKALKILHPSSL